MLGDDGDGNQRQGAGREIPLGEDVGVRVVVVADGGGDAVGQPPVAGEQPADHGVVALEVLPLEHREGFRVVEQVAAVLGVALEVQHHHRDGGVVEQGVGVGQLGRNPHVLAGKHAGGQGQGRGARPEACHQIFGQAFGGVA